MEINTMRNFINWLKKSWTNKIIFISLIVSMVFGWPTLFTVVRDLGDIDGKRLYLSFSNYEGFNLQCLESIHKQTPKINITVTKLEKVESKVSYYVIGISQIRNTCGYNYTFFNSNREICYITIKTGPDAYTSRSSCSSSHPPPTDTPLTVQLNDFLDEADSFELYAFQNSLQTCEIEERIKICPFFDGRLQDDECSEEFDVKITYNPC
jgi:hypothetical protein